MSTYGSGDSRAKNAARPARVGGPQRVLLRGSDAPAKLVSAGEPQMLSALAGRWFFLGYLLASSE
jgi:hypothetical protein